MKKPAKAKLTRQMGLLVVTATGVSSMVGASINIVPFMIHRSVPEIGPYVLWAFVFAALPALMAGLAFAILSSAMPRAGGSYLYASRGLHPYLGFVASFSQWFGLSIVIGVIAYLTIPFVRDIAVVTHMDQVAHLLTIPWIRVVLSLGMIWFFVWINFKGIQTYSRLLLPMVVLIFALGGIVIVSGLFYDTNDYVIALETTAATPFIPVNEKPFNWVTFLSAAAVLFSSFIGFDAIAQTGSEAKNPTRNLPLAILLAILGVGTFYFLFTASVYHMVPWSYIALQAQTTDITAPGMLSLILPSGWDIAILAGAAIALINDLPAMLLSVSRLMFAWASDGIFPKAISQVHPKNHTPYVALIIAGIIASIGVLGSHFAGDFFLGIDIMVIAMLVNFLLMSVTLLSIPRVNPQLAGAITVFRNRKLQLVTGITGIALITLFLVIHIYKDLSKEVEAWYFHSTYVWLLVMVLGSFIFRYHWQKVSSTNTGTSNFKTLPNE
ncbi:APC family permease [Robertkochia marina]|uniref:APC family permease n=1 Tax=Robertkochia marina TaxID=1227945 RepID=A0A4S3M293_9FLAO|nr:APC family permease [Robertkochia marina]THD68785.1 APC family permease [Robertkochia marina]TRZ43858.1 APC family permease [Robertkochia marina]